MNGSGAAKVEVGRKLFNGVEVGTGNGFNVGIVPPHPNQEKQVVAELSTWIGALATAVLAVERQRRLTVPDTKPEPVLDTMRRGKLVENDLVYRQSFVIRSYEAGFDKSASIETISNLFQVLMSPSPEPFQTFSKYFSFRMSDQDPSLVFQFRGIGFEDDRNTDEDVLHLE